MTEAYRQSRRERLIAEGWTPTEDLPEWMLFRMNEKGDRVTMSLDGETERTDHLGIDWKDAPLPPRKHQCAPWTNLWAGTNQYQRCACGAIRVNSPHWLEVNSRRKGEDPEPEEKLEEEPKTDDYLAGQRDGLRRARILYLASIVALIIGIVFFLIGVG